MIKPTSSPDVKRIAMNSNSDVGMLPVQRSLPQRKVIASDVSSVTTIAIERIVCIAPSPAARVGGHADGVRGS